MSLRFYRDGLGFTYLSEFRISGQPTATLLQLQDLDLHAYYLECDGTRIELLHYVSPGAVESEWPRPMNQLGLTHLSLRVTNLPEVVASLRGLGARVLEQTHTDNLTFQAAAVFVTDPDGRLIELMDMPGDPAEPLGTRAQP